MNRLFTFYLSLPFPVQEVVSALQVRGVTVTQETADRLAQCGSVSLRLDVTSLGEVMDYYGSLYNYRNTHRRNDVCYDPCCSHYYERHITHNSFNETPCQVDGCGCGSFRSRLDYLADHPEIWGTCYVPAPGECVALERQSKTPYIDYIRSYKPKRKRGRR